MDMDEMLRAVVLVRLNMYCLKYWQIGFSREKYFSSIEIL